MQKKVKKVWEKESVTFVIILEHISIIIVQHGHPNNCVLIIEKEDFFITIE